MARGRIFSSRRMFSSRRSSFAATSNKSGPLGVTLGLSAAALIIFALGVIVGRSFPGAALLPATMPLAPASTSEPVSMGLPDASVAPLPDEAAPEDEATGADASADTPAEPSNTPPADAAPVTATEN
jgi:hypothetical protein